MALGIEAMTGALGTKACNEQICFGCLYCASTALGPHIPLGVKFACQKTGAA